MAPLSRVLWIAGPAGAGKTTVATRLARRHGLRWYGSDTRTWQHRDRAVREGNAAAARWEALAPGERWVGTDEELLAMSLHRERGRMVVDDVLALPEAPLVVAEGTPVPLGVVDPRLAVCLLPRESLRRARLTERGLSGGPARLYALVASEVERDARARAVPVIEADGVDETLAAVEELFADALAAGPRAGSRVERRALLREANEAVVTQVRGYHARPWATGDPEAVVRPFLCECGDTGCTDELERPVAEAAAGPVLAYGHA